VTSKFEFVWLVLNSIVISYTFFNSTYSKSSFWHSADYKLSLCGLGEAGFKKPYLSGTSG
jgi:hypothetical protein